MARRHEGNWLTAPAQQRGVDKHDSLAAEQDSDVLLLEAGTGPVFVLSCSPGHLHLESSWSGAPADITKTFFLPVWLVLLSLCSSWIDAGGHGGVPGAGVEASKGPGRLCSILPGTGRESMVFSTCRG